MELSYKFYIDSIILESRSCKTSRSKGYRNPFEIKNKVIISSYNFANKIKKDILKINWDIVVIDEAHRLRNVYKSSSKIANGIREARHCITLEDKVKMKRKIKESEKRRNQKRLDLYGEQDKIEAEKDDLIEQIEP